MKKAIGTFLIFLPIISVSGFAVYCFGWHMVLLVWLIVLAMIGIVFLGFYLSND